MTSAAYSLWQICARAQRPAGEARPGQKINLVKYQDVCQKLRNYVVSLNLLKLCLNCCRLFFSRHHTHTWLFFNRSIFMNLHQVRLVPNDKHLRNVCDVMVLFIGHMSFMLSNQQHYSTDRITVMKLYRRHCDAKSQS